VSLAKAVSDEVDERTLNMMLFDAAAAFPGRKTQAELRRESLIKAGGYRVAL